MAKKFGALRSEMSPAAQARAAQRMLAEMPPQALEIYNGNRIREFDDSEAELAQGLSRQSRSKNPFHSVPHHWPTPNRCNLDS